MVKYAPRKVYIRESGGYVELSYTEFCRCRESDQTYMDKLFIPIQGCLLEVVREQYTDFYRDKERWRYLQKLDTKNRLLSLDGFTDSEGNPLDFITDEAVDIAETVVNAVMVDRLKAALPLLSDSAGMHLMYFPEHNRWLRGVPIPLSFPDPFLLLFSISVLVC